MFSSQFWEENSKISIQISDIVFLTILIDSDFLNWPFARSLIDRRSESETRQKSINVDGLELEKWWDWSQLKQNTFIHVYLVL